MKFLKILFFTSLSWTGSKNFLFLLILLNISSYSEGKDQYVQPLNMGMQIAIPYDIANIFNRPINFGPIAGLLSAGCLLYILFFGVITSPFGYFFGVPSEKYVLGEAWKTLPVTKEKTARIGTDYGYYTPQRENYPKYSQPYRRSEYYGQSRSFENSGNVNTTKIGRHFIFKALH